MLYREIMAVYSEINTKHINTVCGQNVELLNVKLAVHIVTTGLQRVNVEYRQNKWIFLLLFIFQTAEKGELRSPLFGNFVRILHCALCTVCCALCTVCCMLCTVYCALCTVYCMLYAVGLAIPHAVIRRSLKAETRDQSLVSPRRSCVMPSDTDRCPQSVPPHTHVSPTLYNINNSDRR